MNATYIAEEIETVKSFLASGKGVIFVASPWAYSQSDGQDTANFALVTCGLALSKDGPSDSSFTISATPHSSYYSALNGSAALVKNKEGTLPMSDSDKKLAANVIRHVTAANVSIPALNANLDILSDDAHYGIIKVHPGASLNVGSKPLEAMLVYYQSAKFDALAPDDLIVHPSTAIYPGAPAAGTPVTKTISINDTTSSSAYMNHGGWPTRIETGLYAAPGEAITITIPADKAGAGLQVHIGGTQDNGFILTTWTTYPKIWRRESLSSTITRTGNVFGGLVTLLVPTNSNLGKFDVTISGALAAPAFILGKTTNEEWNNSVKHNPGAWGYLQTDKITFYAPRSQLVALSNPTEVATYWKKVMDTSDDIFAYTKWRKRGEVISPNRQVAYGGAYASYPIESMWVNDSDHEFNQVRQNGHWGLYHELGHTYQFDFDNAFVIATSAEVDVNLNCGLLYTLVHDKTCWDGSIHSTYNGSNRLTARTNFLALSASEQTWDKACQNATAYDFYFNLAEAFGWDAYKRFFTRLMNYLQNPAGSTDTELKSLSTSDANFKRNRFYLLMCDATGRNLDEYFQRYGIGASGKGHEISASVKSLVAAKGYPVWKDNTEINSLTNPGTLTVRDDTAAGSGIYQFTSIRNATPGTIWDYSITSGNDGAAFSIDKRTGILRVSSLNSAVKSNYSLTVKVQDNGVPRKALSQTFAINVIEAPTSTSMNYTDWRLQHAWNTLPDSEMDADPNGNGISNLLEYAFGMDPIQNQPNDMRFLPGMARDAENNPCFRFHRYRDAEDISYHVETSLDLKNWTVVDTSEVSVIETNDGWETCIVSISPSAKNQFFRVKVVLQ